MRALGRGDAATQQQLHVAVEFGQLDGARATRAAIGEALDLVPAAEELSEQRQLVVAP